MRHKLLILALALTALLACPGKPPTPHADVAAMSWPEILAAARDTKLTMAMWMGDPFINSYMRDFVAPQLKEKFGISIQFVASQGSQIVTALMAEMEAGRARADYDMVWINGETFYQLRQIEALYGPFTGQLPNAQFIDFDNPFIGIDFQQPIDGYECPWGNVQHAMIYDSARLASPPQTLAELAQWVRANPGRFTFDTHFTGMTLLKSWLIAFAPDGGLNGPFDEARYAAASSRLWDFVNGIKPFFWRQGKSFPAEVAQLHQMFANGEVEFTMSNNDCEVDNKVLQGLFPETARAFVFAEGSIQNSHYLGIVAHSGNKPAALVAIDFLISPEAQLRKQDPAQWGDGTILDVDRLPEPWPDRFRRLPNRRFAPSRDAIQAIAQRELAPQYMIRLYADFRRFVLEE